jgi:pimeloyl-ACP methyl ester carboxylesterase
MLSFPVYFVHGLLIWVDVYLKHSKWPEHAKKRAVEMYFHERPHGMTMRQRVDLIAESLERELLKHKRIHLVGHSAGGADIRLLVHLYPEIAKRIISITTIGTPHRGTPIADMVVAGLPKCPPMKDLVGIENARQVVSEMTTTYMRNFNAQVKDVEGIEYFSFPYYIDSIWKSPFSYKTWKCLRDAGFPYNDGTVPLESQIWGTTLGDHELVFANAGQAYNEEEVISHLLGEGPGLETIRASFGDHKAQTFPLRYGFEKINIKLLDGIFNNLVEVEKRVNERAGQLR